MSCKGCKELRDEPFFVKPNVISGRWAFHLYDTHGIIPEMLPEMVEVVLMRKQEVFN